jgi:hypothetical protein
MKLEVKYSTIFVWIISQTIISILFYLGDSFVSGWEAILTFVLSIPLTMLIQWIRGEYKTIEKDEDNSEASQ